MSKMSWKYKVSKFKNTTPQLPKREESVYDLPVRKTGTSGNGIKASVDLIAFQLEGEGGKLGLLPQGAKGRKSRIDVGVICAHRDAVTDFEFAPFDDLLVTCCRDEDVKLWRVNDANCNYLSSVSVPDQLLPLADRPAEAVCFHSTASGLLSVAAGSTVLLWDLAKPSSSLDLVGSKGVLQDLSWDLNGQQLATVDRSRHVQIFDPRSSKNAILTAPVHEGICKEGRVLFLGNENKVLSSGFSKTRLREVMLFDVRQFSTPQHVRQFDTSTGVLMPFYDSDSRLIFLCGKGSNKVLVLELIDREPLLSDGAILTTEHPAIGCCMVPKVCMSVMTGEVARLLQLNQQGIAPIRCTVPRKSYREFHSDLFPDCIAHLPGCSGLLAEHWLLGHNALPLKVSLNPDRGSALSQVQAITSNGVLKRDVITSSSPQNLPLPSLLPETERNGNAENMEYKISHQDVHESLTVPIDNGFEDHVDLTTTTPDDKIVHTDKQPDFESPLKENDQADSPYTARSHNECGGLIFNGDTGTPEDMQLAADAVNVVVYPEALVADDFTDSVQSCDSQSNQAVNTGAVHSVAAWYENRLCHDEDSQPFIETKVTSNVVTTELPSSSEVMSQLSRSSPSKVSPKTQSVSKSKSVRCIQGMRTSLFRHVVVKPSGPENKFTNLRTVNTRLPLESKGFCASARWAAVPLSGTAGIVAIFERNKGGRIADGVIPGIENGCNLVDFVWSPFNENQIACATEDGVVKFWTIPDGGISSAWCAYDFCLKAHNEKVTSMCFHPSCAEIFATASSSGSLKIWRLDSRSCFTELKTDGKSVITFCWNTDGSRLWSISKDGLLMMFIPSKSAMPTKQVKILESGRAARILCVCRDNLLLVSCFNKSSDRLLNLYDSTELTLQHSLKLTSGPNLLIPFYDYDTSCLFLSSKGDCSVLMYEIILDDPYFLPLNTFTSASYQSIAFQPKTVCNVKIVEFACAFRLCAKEVDLLSFTVPRKELNYFQNDVFPPSLQSWVSSISAADWCNGVTAHPVYVSLKPADMDPLRTANDDHSAGGDKSHADATLKVNGCGKNIASSDVSRGDVSVTNGNSQLIESLSNKIDYTDNEQDHNTSKLHTDCDDW